MLKVKETFDIVFFYLTTFFLSGSLIQISFAISYFSLKLSLFFVNCKISNSVFMGSFPESVAQLPDCLKL